MKPVRVVRQFAKDLNTIVEGNDHNAIVWPEVIKKGQRRRLDLVERAFSRAAGIQQQGDAEWFFYGTEQFNVLLYAILKDSEVISSQIAHVAAAVLADDNGYLHKSRVQLDWFFFLRNRLLTPLLLCAYWENQQRNNDSSENHSQIA
jgi:hypothetical protein